MTMNSMDRRYFLRCSIALPAFAGIGSVAIANPAATADIALVREILTALHPGLYRYSSPAEIGLALTRLEQQWTAQPDLASRYLNLSRFLAMIKCGHSYANFYNQSGAVKEQLFGGKTRLPFAFKWIGNEMVVLQDQSGTASLPRGTVVKTINGVRANDILARLLPYARADGNNDDKRRALLSVTGADDLETFDIFYGLLYGAPKGGEHQLRIRKPGSKRDWSVSLTALTLEQRKGFIKRADIRGDTPSWEWTIRDDGIAVLQMDNWGLFNSKWDWKGWLDDRLDSLAGAKGFIVDIRENEGGLDCGDLILSRLAPKDIVVPATKQLVRYRKTPEHLNRYLDTWDKSFRDWGENAVRYDDRFYRLKRGGDGIIPAKAPRISVPVAVLTSSQNSSATFRFASLCKSTGLATLVGEATGGNQRGINGGAFFFARLPESGIEFDVPLIGYFPERNTPDAGIEPDILVKTSARTIAGGSDPQMDAAVRYLLPK